MINIPRDIIDPFYRYQRQKAITQLSKQSIRIVNVNEIAKAIYLTDKTLMKFFQKKNGCKAKADILFNKNLKSEDIENQIEELISMLICKICKNPEFEVYSEKKKAFNKCKACGNEIQLDEELKKILSYELESKSKPKQKKTLEDELNNFNTNILGEQI